MSVAAIQALAAGIWAATTLTEAVAFCLGIVYVVLVIRQSRACWLAACVSTALYAAVFYRAGLFMQAGQIGRAHV